MPIAIFHLAEGSLPADKTETFLEQVCADYAAALECPIERTRAFIITHPVEHDAVAGSVPDAATPRAPYFEFFTLTGRPDEQRHALGLRFSELLAETLSIEQSIVRGQCIQIDPGDWFIGGTPASELRAAEIAKRKAVASVAGQ